MQKLNDQIYDHFVNRGEEPAPFFDTIKPFADQVKMVSDHWRNEALQFVDEVKPAYLHREQVENTHENINAISVTCFQPKTKKKRFIETVKANQLIFDQFLKDITKMTT